MADDFGSRGDLQQLPLLNHDNDRPTKVEDRTLADVIVESFDSLTTTFDEFTKHLETLNKRDVYEATKQAIIDTNANGGGRGGTPTNVTINDTLTKNFEEVKRYWLAKAQREEAHLKQQQKDEEERAKKQLEATQRATMDGFLKWTNQALTNNPIAFLQDFMWKKVFEPFIMRLGNAPEQKKEEERKAKQEKEKDRQEEDKREKSRQENLESLLKTNSEYIVDGFDKSLKTNLQGFADDLTQFAGMLFSGRMSGGNQGGINRMGISPMGTAIGQRALGTDIDAQDDAEDMQKASDDTTALITEPENTEFGSAILDALNKDAEETEKKEEEKEDSLLDKLFNNPMMMGLLKFGALVTGVTYIVRVLTNISNKFNEWRRKLPPWLGGDTDFVGLPVQVMDSKVNAGAKNIAEIKSSSEISDKLLDKISSEVQSNISSGSNDFEYSVDDSLLGLGAKKMRQTDFASLLNETGILTDSKLKGFFDSTDKMQDIAGNKAKQRKISSYLQNKLIENAKMSGTKIPKDAFSKTIGGELVFSATRDRFSELSDDEWNELAELGEQVARVSRSVHDSFTWSGMGGSMIARGDSGFEVASTDVNIEQIKGLGLKGGKLRNTLGAVVGNAYLADEEERVTRYETELSNGRYDLSGRRALEGSRDTSTGKESVAYTNTVVNTYMAKHTEDCDISGGK